MIGHEPLNRKSSSADSGPRDEQYSLAKILFIWALAAFPMALISWIIIPAVSPDAVKDPLGAGVTRIALLAVGLIWLFMLSMLMTWQEKGNLRWSTVKSRLRLNAPRDPRTGEVRHLLWLWCIVLIAASALWELALASHLNGWWTSLVPLFAEPEGYSMSAVFESPATLEKLAGAWWFLALFLVQAIFNTVLGEEFLFRGVLLPKMSGAFGRWSWLANGVLHGLYHLHQPWGIPGNIVSCTLFYAYPSWKFSSTWMGVIVHSAQSVFFAFLILGVVLGRA
jgi:uncharacterized protein